MLTKLPSTQFHDNYLIDNRLFFPFLSYLEDNEKKKKEEEGKSGGKVNEQNGDNAKRSTGNDVQKTLLIDLSNDAKPTGNSWVSDKHEYICPITYHGFSRINA